MSFGQGLGGLFGGGPSDRSGDGSSRSQPPSGGPGRPGGPNDGEGNGSGEGQGRRRRPSALLLTIIILAALAGLFVLFMTVYTDVLWFNQAGFAEVFWTEHLTRGVLFLIGGVVMGAVTWLAMWLAWRSRPRNIDGQQRDTLHQYQRQLEPVRRLVFIGVPVLIGFFAGSAAMNGWQSVLLFFNQVPYGETDPEFGLDLMFYMATLPFLGTLVGFVISVILVAGITGLLVHYLYGGIRIQERGGISVEKSARWHIIIFVALFVLMQGVNYWLDRYRTLQDQSGEWAGAMYTDVNAVIPTSTILAVATIVVIALLIATLVSGRWRFAIIGTASLVVAALVAGVAYPALIQNYQVEPTERTMEQPYIDRHIQYTREAYDVADTESTNYAGETDPEAGALATEETANANIRLMDPNLLNSTFGQLQQFRPYYSFPDTLHTDRYQIDEDSDEVTDTVIAPREVNVDPNSSWVNQHVTYTHGYGMVAADTSTSAEGGRPSFVLSGIPTSGPLASDDTYEPRIYFGMNSPEYSVVGNEEGEPDKERDRPQDARSDEDTNYTFSGDGGPSVGNLFNQLAYALRFGDTELVLSQDVNSNSQILYERNPVERVQKVAPYLEVDPNAYPAIVDGRIKWIIEGYTTSDAFPYSSEQQLDSATTDALSANQQFNLSGQVNFIRNSVKATVDAYSGEVSLYAWEPEDPLLQAWDSVYDTSLQPYSEMSAELMNHVRYPEDMFKVQREVLARFHVTDALDFYENNDVWSVPTDPTQGDRNVAQPPYYMTLQMPGQEEPAFQLTSNYIPEVTETGESRNVLYGFLGANGDAGTGEDGVKSDGYGQLELLELPRQTTTPGPGQAQANFDSNATVSRELNLLRQGASDVINGNMITLPVADGILYVQPVYVQSTGTTSYPTLRRVLVSFGEEIGFAPTLSEALDQVFEGDSGAAVDDSASPGEDVGDPNAEEGEAGEGGADAEPPMADSNQEQLNQALQDAVTAMQASEEAMANSDWAAYGQAQADLQDALSRATEADESIDGGSEDGAEGGTAESGAEGGDSPSPNEQTDGEQ